MRRINRCMNNKLLGLCQRAIQLDELNSKLSILLPPSLRAHCHVGSFSQGCLLIVVQDPVWASQLRYVLPELRDKLRQEAGIYQLSSIKVNMAANQEATSINTRKTPVLSHKAREAIIAGGSLCHYPPLKEALYRLGQETGPHL